MKQSLVSVILPVYNERENLLRLIPKIRALVGKVPGARPEVIVIDDDSSDGSAAAIRRQFGNTVRVIRRTGLRGLGTAIGTGIRQARGSVIIGMDADGNHDPAVIPALLHALGSCDIVVASRFIKGGGMKPWWQQFLSGSFNAVVRHMLGFPVTDNTSGFYAIRTRDVIKLGLDRIYYGYGEYHLRLMYRAAARGFLFREVPVTYGMRTYGQSKSKILIMAFTYLMTACRLRFG